jgi:hypothetical protein
MVESEIVFVPPQVVYGTGLANKRLLSTILAHTTAMAESLMALV